MTAKAITCVICGSESAREVAERRSVHLLGHVATFARREYKCTACGESFTTDDQGEGNERAERLATARALKDIEGAAELKRLRDLMHLTQPELENALGLGRNTVARWETGQRPVPAYIKTIIRLVAVNPTALALLKDQDLSDESASERTSRKA